MASLITLNKVMSEAIADAWPVSQGQPRAEMGTMLFGSGKAGRQHAPVSGYSIPTSCSDTATAAAYINFWTNDDASAKIFASDNGAVANQKQLQQQIADPASPGVKTVLQQYQTILDAKVPTQTIPSGYNAVFEQVFRRDYQGRGVGCKTVDQAVDAFFTEANNSLERSDGIGDDPSERREGTVTGDDVDAPSSATGGPRGPAAAGRALTGVPSSTSAR